MKIKNIKIKGIRGIKDALSLNLSGNSILIYGDNGSGKTSIIDGVEWFYKDRVDHLSIEEIDKKGGISALRNIHLHNKDSSFIEINFSTGGYGSKKNLSTTLKSSHSNSNTIFNQYLQESDSENLILRYSDLTKFVLATKTEKLKTFSKIIGLDELDKIKTVIRRGMSYLITESKNIADDTEISRKNGMLLEIFGENIISDENFIEKVNFLINKIGIESITTLPEIEQLSEKLKKQDGTNLIKKELWYQQIFDTVKSIKNKSININDLYKKFYLKFEEITHEKENIKKLALERLLSEGISLIMSKNWELNKCPLCLEKKDLKLLDLEIRERIEEIGIITKKKKELDSIKEDLIRTLNNAMLDIKRTEEESVRDKKDILIQDFLETSKKKIDNFLVEVNKNIGTVQLRSVEELKIDESFCSKIQTYCEREINDIKTKVKENSKIDIQEKIVRASYIYSEIKNAKKKKAQIEGYISAIEKLYEIFIQKQKNEIESFINNFSMEINTYYSALHPGESVSNISLKLLGDKDDLKGLTLEYEFYDNKESPPQKYLSESHLNSLGIAFFLSSVKAFNKRNEFFILDDIISSFDSDHRLRLSELLIETFKDYQIIILTHEKAWFEYMKNYVKGKNNWLIKSVHWSNDEGTHLEKTKIDLKDTIEKKIERNDVEGLGNLMRQYLESLLKEICENLEVKVKYLSNEQNEKRMCNELLCDLKSKINKQPSRDLFPIIDILLDSVFVSNIASHDNSIKESMGDLRTFWDHILKLESFFYCTTCNKLVSVKFSIKNSKKIQCNCGNIVYSWKY